MNVPDCFGWNFTQDSPECQDCPHTDTCEKVMQKEAV
jgi:hypothetical protein